MSNNSNNIARSSTADESDNWRRKPNNGIAEDQQTNSFQRRSNAYSNSSNFNHRSRRYFSNKNDSKDQGDNNQYYKSNNTNIKSGFGHGAPLPPNIVDNLDFDIVPSQPILYKNTTYYANSAPYCSNIAAIDNPKNDYSTSLVNDTHKDEMSFCSPPPTAAKITIKMPKNDKKNGVMLEKKNEAANDVNGTKANTTPEQQQNTIVEQKESASPEKWKRFSEEHGSPDKDTLSNNTEDNQPISNKMIDNNFKYRKPAAIKKDGHFAEQASYSEPVPFAKNDLKRRKPGDKENEPAAAAYQQENWRSTAAPLPPPGPKPYQHQDDRNNSKRRELFKPFLSPTKIEEQVQDGTLYQGIIRFSRNRHDAYVTSEDLDTDIYIGGFADRNRSLHGDLVAVKLLDVDTIWNLRKEREAKRFQDRVEKRNEAKKKQQEEDGIGQEVEEDEEANDLDEEEEKEETKEEEEEHKPKYCGEVVGIILRPPNAAYSGTITISRFADAKPNIAPGEMNKPLRMAFFKPTDMKIPFLVLRNTDIPKDLVDNEAYYKSHLFSADIRRWQICDVSPTGRIIKEIGPLGDLMVEREAILADNSIIDKEFPQVALKDLPILPWSIPEEELNRRRDLRSETIFSIDPVTAKDLDDALHIKQLEDGFFEVGVHIADVSYFLKKGSALDNEAKDRGTSTYLVDSVIPMLPPVLCEELCSLNPGVDRLAFSVIWKLDAYGKPVDTWYGKTVIRSCAKLAYENAQAVIDGDELPDNITIHDNHSIPSISSDIFMLYKLSAEMRERRYTSGSLTLNSVKLNFQLDENGEPTSVFKFKSKEANRLVEEFMLLANISVAKKIASAYPDEALLRKHEEPLPRRLNDFLKLTDTLGLDFIGYNAGDLQGSFDKVNNKDVKDVLLVLAIRCMTRAKYFCCGSQDITKYRHYALNEPLYTHFTSPIRRYADVVVHRLLEAALKDNRSCGYTKKIVQRLSFHCNSKRDGAKNAQDRNTDMYLARYLSNLESQNGPVYTKADVIMVTKDTYEIYVPEYGIEKKFHVEDLPTESHFFDKFENSLDIFWKRGQPVTMHNEEKIYAQERIRKDDYSDDEEEDEDSDSSGLSPGEELEKNLEKLTLKENKAAPREKVTTTDELIPAVVLEPKTCLQRLKMFSSIDVRIQINMDRSPPIINVYPVNPFSGEEVKKTDMEKVEEKQ